MKKPMYIIGVDEVGRGPLAGPVTVCATIVPRRFVFGRANSDRPNDSKKLSIRKREEWFLYAEEHPKIFYATASVSPSVIDRIGISCATMLAVERSLKKLSSTWSPGLQVEEVEVLLDGLLHAPAKYKQKTIIKGDEIEPIISLASIIAKVTRDKYMTNLAKKYPEYGFEKHKGYGTREHYKNIKKYGISDVHRKSFLRGLQK